MGFLFSMDLFLGEKAFRFWVPSKKRSQRKEYEIYDQPITLDQCLERKGRLSNWHIPMTQLSNTDKQRFKLPNNCPLVCCVTIFRLQCGQHSGTHPRLCSGLNGRKPLLPKDMSSFLQMDVNSQSALLKQPKVFLKRFSMSVLDLLVHIFIGKPPCTTCRLTFECWSIIVHP